MDEASFLGARQAQDLIRVVEELQERGGQAKLHLLGDVKQMQAITAGESWVSRVRWRAAVTELMVDAGPDSH